MRNNVRIPPAMNDTRSPLPEPEVTSSELERLRAAVHRAEQAERLQRALFAISELSSSDLEMPHMLQQLHAIVGSLTYARNLFMALYDEASDSLDFIYMVDEATPDQPQSGQRIPMADYAQALTWYLVRDGLPRRGSMQALAQQVPGPLRARGAHAQDWLGVPLREGGHVRSALVVQSYDEPNRYGPEEQALLEFVASHVLTAVQRKQSQQALEQAVQVRTAELARANLPGVEVICGDATEVGPRLLAHADASTGIFTDPARRTASGRSWRVADFSPSWDFVLSLVASGHPLCVKLGPAA